MKVLTVVLAICMLSVIGCSNDNDAEIAELKSQIQELQQAQSTTVASATAAPASATSAPATATSAPTAATAAPVMPNTLQAHNFQILDRHPDPKLDCINDSMDVFIDVFGVVVIATNSAPLPYVVHTAGVLAQFLDNDEDGVPDEPNVLHKLVEGNYVVPVWSKQEEEEFFQLRTVGSCEDNIGMAASMYFDHDAWALGGIQSTGTWDTNLEE
ncbi:MAG: hypothetical protein CL752_08220, partial [Chloroflexi bacterium]|nr:hypothetical protein [Chloroflexota bacterium]